MIDLARVEKVNSWKAVLVKCHSVVYLHPTGYTTIITFFKVYNPKDNQK